MEPNTESNQSQNPEPTAPTASAPEQTEQTPQIAPHQEAPSQSMHPEQPKDEGKSFLEHITGLFNRGKKPQTPEQPQG